MNKDSVLWADDDADDLRNFNEAADEINKGLEIVTVQNGRELLDYLREAVANDDLPSMIIMDMNMPLVSGREALAAIKKDEKLREIPLAVFTTSNSPNDLSYCSQFEVTMFTKPWQFSSLKDVVSEILKLRLERRHD
jgi:CheY-like chemotaxis protein